MPILHYLRFVTIGIAFLLALAGCHSDTQQKLPAFKTTALDGSSITDQQLNGKVSVINFSATSCTTCVKEMPEMINAFNKFKPSGLSFIAIAMSYDPPMYVVNFSKTRQLPFTVAMDSDGSAAKAFGKVRLTPTTFVINKQGRIIKRYVGEPDWAEFHKVLEKALSEA